MERNQRSALLHRLAAGLILVGSGLLPPSSVLAEELKESPNNEIGYRTVEEALEALRKSPGVQVSQQGGWTIIVDAASSTMWSFTPAEHPAHPSAVKRSIAVRDGSTYIDMKVHCEASKTACDKLVVDFQQLNEQMTHSIQGRNPPAVAAPALSAPNSGNESVTTREEINVTSDSDPGWLPSADQRARVPQAAREFLAALDGGQYQRAYDLMAASQQALESFDSFRKRLGEFNASAGAAKERRILKVTWTKDPANAPAPGIYAAVDIASRFENVDRHCGYLMLYQRDVASPFLVMRQEDNYITNDNARQIAMKQSPQAVDDIWRRLSTNCPNYAVDVPPSK